MKQSPSLVRDHLQVEKPTPLRNLDRQEETVLEREDSETNIWGKIYFGKILPFGRSGRLILRPEVGMSPPLWIWIARIEEIGTIIQFLIIKK